MSLLKEILTEEPPDILYHYTSPAGLYGIITNKSLWATNIHYFNDSSEFSYSVKIASEMSRFSSYEPEFKQMVHSCLSSISKVNKFVFSLTEDGNLLSQWRGYCPPTGGYSLGFDYEKLSHIISVNNEFRLYPCQYDNKIQRQLISEVLNEAHNHFLTVSEKGMGNIIAECSLHFVTKFSVVAAMIKDPS